MRLFKETDKCPVDNAFKLLRYFICPLQYIETFLYICAMKRRIITFGRYFSEFMEGLTVKEREKVDYGLVLLKTQGRLPAKFVKYIRDGLFELRTEYNGNIYRVFFIFDEGNIVVLFNGFQKKSQKIPVNEIVKALKIKEEYYDYKRNNDQ